MQEKTEIVAILDRSGSMGSVVDDAIGGFNTFLAEQQELPGEASLTLILFDDDYSVIYDNVDIRHVKPLNHTTFVPRGLTALNDAIGRAIDTVGNRLSCLRESARPNKVIVSILTDGGENASREYSQVKVAEMIQRQQERYNWDVIFLAANQDAWAVGSTYRIPKTHCHTYVANGLGTRSAYASMSSCVASARSGGDIDLGVDNTSAKVQSTPTATAEAA